MTFHFAGSIPQVSWQRELRMSWSTYLSTPSRAVNSTARSRKRLSRRRLRFMSITPLQPYLSGSKLGLIRRCHAAASRLVEGMSRTHITSRDSSRSSQSSQTSANQSASTSE